jgi:hypothetical protein
MVTASQFGLGEKAEVVACGEAAVMERGGKTIARVPSRWEFFGVQQGRRHDLPLEVLGLGIIGP